MYTVIVQCQQIRAQLTSEYECCEIFQTSGGVRENKRSTVGCCPVKSRLVAPVDVSLVGIAFILPQNLLNLIQIPSCRCLVQLCHFYKRVA